MIRIISRVRRHWSFFFIQILVFLFFNYLSTLLLSPLLLLTLSMVPVNVFVIFIRFLLLSNKLFCAYKLLLKILIAGWLMRVQVKSKLGFRVRTQLIVPLIYPCLPGFCIYLSWISISELKLFVLKYYSFK